jgi:O-acetyl-ADP-ribose deacetylase (regulator of RNase III)
LPFRIEVVDGDITKQSVEAIRDAANTSLLSVAGNPPGGREKTA